MKNFFLANSLVCIYVISQFLLLIFAQLPDSIIGDVNIHYASLFHSAAIVLVILGYSAINPIKARRINIGSSNQSIIIKKQYYLVSYTLIIVGLTTAIATTTVGGSISATEYLLMFSSQDSLLLDIRHESGTAGLSGAFKMLNYLPLTIYLFTVSISIFSNIHKNDKSKLKKLEYISLLAVLIKILFSLDRLSFMAITIALLFRMMYSNKISFIKTLTFGSIGLLFINFITAIRMSNSNGVLGLLTTYSKLSLANFEIVLDRQTEFGYIGTNTFLFPLVFIGKFFGIKIPTTNVIDYIWNPAQYFNSDLFLDFGYFSILMYFFIGIILRVIESKKRNNKLFFKGGYLIFIFVIISFITVPFIRSAEFWVMLCVIYYLSHFTLIKNIK